MDEKASKKCSNMAKREQIASLAISRGGGKKTIFATGGTSGAEKYSPEEMEGRGRAILRGRTRTRKGKRRGEVKQEQVAARLKDRKRMQTGGEEAGRD